MKSNTVVSLKGMRDKVKLLSGITSAAGSLVGLDQAFELALDESKEKAAEREASQKHMKELLDKARLKDADALHELNELRMETIDLYVRATSQFAQLFFEPVVLKENEQFVVEHSYRNPVAIRFVGQDGGARTVKAVKARKQTFVDVRELMSNDVGYQMRDIQQGTDIASASQATVDVSFDLANKVDLEAFNLVQGGTVNGKNYGAGVFGAFTTTGAPLSRAYIPNARINTANLPTTNDILNAALDDNGGSNVFRLAVIRAIMKYCDSWGNIWGAPIRPTGAILIPSSESTALSQEIKPTGTFHNQVAEGLLEQYTVFDYMGIHWTLVPDVTLPPGTCYPVLSRPVGRLLTKPSFDQEFVESNPRKNWETRVAMKVLALCFFEPWRVNALRVTYTSANGGGAASVVTANE